ncbi:MAG TPA: alanine--tRNA ligase [bacterium]|nr:alanine--tRNA ligase [bacterium]
MKEDLRQKFLKFFEKRGHKIMPSSSLISSDPSVLLTTAGMEQFKSYFTLEKDPLKELGTQRVATCQKCFRTSDIDEVGDESHLTFFEMLGNFSFGKEIYDDPQDFSSKGYFKRAAIHWAFEFLNQILDLKSLRFFVTVFKGEDNIPFDKESFEIWEKEIGIEKEKILLKGKEDNFWGPVGLEGPCGPTTEIHLEGIEVWNLVFNQYYQDEHGNLTLLKAFGVDTGMGLERLAMIYEGKKNVFETSLFLPLMEEIEKYASELDLRKKRIFADHLRAVAFLESEGLVPSNKAAGYILRRLIRKVVTFAFLKKLPCQFFEKVLLKVVENYQDFYPELLKNKEKILETFFEEKKKFEKTLSSSLKKIEKFKEIGAKEAFFLFETYGIPQEILREIAPQKIKFTQEEFEKEMEKHREISRKGAILKFGGHGISDKFSKEEIERITKLHTATHLLQAALRQVLGDEVRQMGSDITPERLRFDFTFPRKLTDEELKKVEDLVNQKIKEGLEVVRKEMPLKEALKQGALAFFKEKYPEKVSVYFIGDFSKEICAGPHVKNTSELKEFKILKEEGVSAGVRRIKATLKF